MHPLHTHAPVGRRYGDANAYDQGSTLVELLAAMLAAAILVLTAGVMIVYASRESQRNTAGMNMQADGRVAMQAIGRSIRGVSTADVSVVASDDLRITRGGYTERFYVNAQNLVHDPSMAVVGDEILLANGTLAVTNGFAASLSNNLVVVILSLTAGDHTYQQTVEGAFTCRN
jgi:Tfp pilus assembly protein PilW